MERSGPDGGLDHGKQQLSGKSWVYEPSHSVCNPCFSACVGIGFESQDNRKGPLPSLKCGRNLGLPSCELIFLVFFHVVAGEARIAGRILKELREDQLRCIDREVSQDGNTCSAWTWPSSLLNHAWCIVCSRRSASAVSNNERDSLS
jgi:hypothetical protein